MESAGWNLVWPLSSKQISVAGGRCSRGFPRGAGAFLPWQWISWRSMEDLWHPKISESKYVDFCNFSPDLIKIHQRNIRISSIPVYHGYSVILDVGKFTTWCFSGWHAMGGLRETFRGMMVASARPWFDKAMTIGPWQHKTNKIEERNNIFDRSTKSQLIFWPFKSKFRSFLAKRNGCGFPRILQVLATKNAWDEQTAAEQI